MQFYVLKRPEVGSGDEKVAGTEAHQADGTNRGDAPRCPECGSYIGMLKWLSPYRVEMETWGREFGDVIVMTYPDMLISQRFKELWKKSDMTGLSGLEPVEVVKIKRRRKSLKDDPPPYFKASVVRGRAALDNGASQSEWNGVPDLCPECRLPRNEVTFLRQQATIIEPGTWSGEDIFIPRASTDFLVTPRFKEFCEQHNVKNTFFIPAEQHGVDFYPSPAKRMQSVLRCWEDKEQSAAARRDAYCTLVFWITGDRSTRQLGKLDPDRDIEATIIEEARRRIQEEL